LTMLTPVYHHACPNCGGPITAERLEKGLPCTRCLPDSIDIDTNNLDYYELVALVGSLLAKSGNLHGYWYLYSSVQQLREFSEFFRSVTGSDLWSAQRTWAKRLLQHESLAIVAPTGVGKTTLLSVYALYRAIHGDKIYYALPTGNLVIHVEKKLEQLASRLDGVNRPRIVSYHSMLSKKLREERISSISAEDYDILVTTSTFLSRKWDLINGRRFEVVLVDDVDAVLRNSKNIDKLLLLLGFDEETISNAYNVVKKRITASIAKASGRIKLYEKLLEELEILEAKLAQKLASTVPGQLVIASATGRAYGLKPKVFRELLGFDIGRVYDYTRSIVNFYAVSPDPISEAVKIVSKLGGKGLVFVAKRFGKKTAREIASALNAKGIRAGVAIAGTRVLDRFARGEYDVLVGIASYYGTIVRGLDLPERVLYTIFVGAPSQALDAAKAILSPYRVIRIGLALGIEGIDELAKKLSKLSPGEQTVLRIAMQRKEELEGRLGEILENIRRYQREILMLVKKELKNKDHIVLGGVLFAKQGSKIIAIIPDAATYVQASGRASRMYGSHMTHGISIIIDTNPDIVELLKERLKRFIDNVDFEQLDWTRIREEMAKAEKSRTSAFGKKVDIETSLIIVESPTKAKTIASFFGKPVRRKVGSIIVYETTFYNESSGKIHVATIAASAGHVYDLSIDGEGIYGVELTSKSISPIYKPIKKCLNCGHQFSSAKDVCPKCGSVNVVSKSDIIDALRQLATEAETVYIATDPDIEGEKIAYDLYVLLKPYARNIKRIELHEITRKELMKALSNPRGIDKRLAFAQIVRRVEDRWIGFGLSQHLWSVFGKNWLGAGRVQTPVLGWIVERYKEWRENAGYNIYAKLEGGLRIKIFKKQSDDARKLAEAISRNGLVVKDINIKEVEINPPPPYTTETLLYDASRILGYPAQKTMKIAQELFEAGLITYHRTDSTHVSGLGQGIAKEYMAKIGLVEDFYPRSWGPQGHHEAIRPTRPIDSVELRRLIATGDLKVPIGLRESHYRLYDLIFRRFMASQARSSKLLRADVVLEVPDVGENLNISIYVDAIYEGYHRFYQYPRVYAELKSLSKALVLKPVLVAVKKGSRITLYSHGEVVALMKQKGIGRPSTYAKTIDTLERHGYVIESKYRKKLIPTKLGIEVYNYLSSNYGELVSEERTRKLYEEIERITIGELDATTVIKELYLELEELLEPSTGFKSGQEGVIGV
jgi:reverse gyrase